MSDIYHDIFHSSPVALLIIQDGLIQLGNPTSLQLFGYTAEELCHLPLKCLLRGLDFSQAIAVEQPRWTGQNFITTRPFQITNNHNLIISVTGCFSAIRYNGRPAILAQFLQESSWRTQPPAGAPEIPEIKYKEVMDSLHEVVFEIDLEGKVTFANSRAYEFFGLNEADYLAGVNALDYVVSTDREKMRDNMWKVLRGEKDSVTEYMAQKKDGTAFPVLIHSSGVFRDGQPAGLRGIIVDITERKRMEEQLKHLSQHDTLTGLYNRSYFEHEMLKLKKSKTRAGILICDVDGLKLINDTLGHSYGDQLIITTAALLRQTFQQSDVVARIGGDEFAVLYSDIDENSLEEHTRQLSAAILKHNQIHTQIPISVSYGYAIREDGLSNPDDLLKAADDKMYKKKLSNRQNNRQSIVQMLISALEPRDYLTDGHADRLRNLMLGFAVKIGLPEDCYDDLSLFARFHDIGKVGIPDHILYKNGPLTKEEEREIQRHPEIGYRIAQSAPDLAPISEWILKHHEWWNGNGYPLGLAGESIPIECRILAIADAYDSLTNDRPYRKAIPRSAALDELQSHSGVQFDPQLVPLLSEVIGL